MPWRQQHCCMNEQKVQCVIRRDLSTVFRLHSRPAQLQWLLLPNTLDDKLLLSRL